MLTNESLKVFHVGKAAPDGKALKALVADKFKVHDEATIILKDTRTSFGGCFTKTHINIYESKEALIKYEPYFRCVRAELVEKKKPISRKMLKNNKNKLKTKRCAEKGKITMTNKAKK